MDKKYFDINVMGCDWTILLDDNGSNFSKNKYFDYHKNIVRINCREVYNAQSLLAIIIEGLYDIITERLCSDIDTRTLAQFTSQLYIEPKTRNTINNIIKVYNRYHINGDEYEKYNSDSYMLDYISVDNGNWELEIWIGESEEPSSLGCSGIDLSYSLLLDPSKFNNAEDIIQCLDDSIKNTTKDAEGIYADLDRKLVYSYDALIKKLKYSNINEIKNNLTDNFDTLLPEK